MVLIQIDLKRDFLKLLIFATLSSASLVATTTFGAKSTETEPKKPPSKSRRILVDRLDASVNSVPILKSDIQKFRALLGLRSQLDPLFAGTPLAEKGQKATDEEICQFLLNEKLITQLFPVTDTEVDQEINSVKSNNGMDQSALESTLQRGGYKYPDYYELMRITISKRNLISAEIRSKVTISDEDVEHELLSSGKGSQSGPKEIHLQMIKIPIRDYKTSSAAYDAANQARKQIVAGSVFADVAQKYNPDGSTGELPPLSENEIDSGFKEQVKKLKVGELSPVFGGPSSGYYVILKLTGFSTRDSEHQSKQKEEVRAKLAAKEFQHQLTLWLERQRQSAFIHRAGESTTQEIPLVQ